MGVADVQQSLGGALTGADDLDSQAFLALEVLDGLDIVSVAGDEDVGVSVVGEAHHIDDDAHVPVTLMGYDALPIGREGLVDDERLRAHLIAELVEVVDEGAGRARSFVRLLLLNDIKGGAQELPIANGGGEENTVIEDAL